MRVATRLVLAGVVLALVAVWALVLMNWQDDGASKEAATEDEPSATDDAVPSGPSPLSGVLKILPTVSHPGNVPAVADAASTVMTAKFRPAQKGAVVLLEQQQGSKWLVVGSAEQDRSGTAVFNDVRPPRGGAVYRATALKPDGTRGVSTNTMPTNRWSLIFGDQFDGTSLDTAKWAYRDLGRYNESGSRLCSMSDERGVGMGGGTLKLHVIEDPARLDDPCVTPEDGTLDYYLNGHISTDGSFDFTYGVAAARIKFPQGRGQHGAFWMQPSGEVTKIPGNPAKSGAEVDVVEYFGEGYPDGGLASFLYYLNADNESEKVGGVWPKPTKELPPGDDWWRSYHVFSVEWTKKQYVFRVDGREIFRTKEGVSGIPQYLILSLLSSDWELPKMDNSTLPSTMDVDWVRVWKQTPMTESDAG